MNKQVIQLGEWVEGAGLTLAMVWHVILIASLALPAVWHTPTGSIEVSEVSSVSA